MFLRPGLSPSKFDENFRFDGQVNFGARTEADHAEAFASFDRISDLFHAQIRRAMAPVICRTITVCLLSFEHPCAPCVNISAGRITRIKESAGSCFGVGNLTGDRRAVHVNVEDGRKNGDALDFAIDQMIFAVSLISTTTPSAGATARSRQRENGARDLERSRARIEEVPQRKQKRRVPGREAAQQTARDAENPTSFAQRTQFHCLTP